MLLVLGVSFWSICCHVCYCCKLYEFVGNFFFYFCWFVGGLHSWFLCVDHKLCIRHVTAQSEFAQTVFRGEAGELSCFVCKLMIKSFDYAAISSNFPVGSLGVLFVSTALTVPLLKQVKDMYVLPWQLTSTELSFP